MKTAPLKTRTSTRRITALRVAAGAIAIALGVLGAESALASSSAAHPSTSTATNAKAAITTAATTATAPATVTAALVSGAAPVTATATVAASTSQASTSRTLTVPVYYQAYTLSCEEAALRMALASEGINVTDAQVLAIIGSDRTAAYTDASGLHWGDPYATFVGNVSGGETNLTGYGTYYPTIAKAATALGGTVLAAGEAISPQSVYQYVLAGHPVVTWVTYQWVNAQRSDYVAFDGRVIPYAGPVEHAVTIVGVTPTEVIVNDPDFGRTVISKSLFEARYATYNNMAVVLK